MTTEDGGSVERLAERVLLRVLALGIDGIGPFRSAESIAARALAKHGSERKAIDEVIADHSRLVALNGFVTGLGGLVTMVIALPINVVGFALLSARMAAAIASIRGLDVADPATRTEVLLTLTGGNASEVLAKAGVAVPGGRIASSALKRLPSSTLAFINKGIAFRVLARSLGKGVARFGRLVPLLGGVVGAIIDRALLRSIAKNARSKLQS
jgi:energy-converting hydrogenase Eha subunit C